MIKLLHKATIGILLFFLMVVTLCNAQIWYVKFPNGNVEVYNTEAGYNSLLQEIVADQQFQHNTLATQMFGNKTKNEDLQKKHDEIT